MLNKKARDGGLTFFFKMAKVKQDLIRYCVKGDPMKKRVFTIGLISVVLGTVSLSAQVAEGELGTEPVQTVQTGESVYAISAQDEFFNELLALKAEINELRVLVLDLKSEVTIKRTELNALQNSINESSKMLLDLKERNVAMQKEMNQTTLALENTLKEKAVIEEELALAKAELAPLNEQRNATLADISKGKADLAVLNEQKEKTQNEVAQASQAADGGQSNTAAEQPVRFSFVAPPANVVKRSEGGVLLNTIYFNPDSTELVAAIVPELDAIGYKMTDDPSMKIAVRGYSAPAGSFLGQIRVSQARAKEAAEYLMTNFHISSDRIIIEWVGATEIPRTMLSYTNFTQYRAVELSAVL
jgi:outer membrane protein OmpA-like peptidoglycan-associated protein